MIDQSTAEAARSLVSQGVSRRQTAKRLGISRETVNKILDGRWRPRRPAQPSPNGHPTRLVPPYRCATCRSIVKTSPCLLCHIRSEKEAERKARKTDRESPQ